MSEIQAQSPVVRAQAVMDFPDAIRALIKGAKIARVEWSNDDFCQRWDGWLMVNRAGKWHTWQVSSADMDAKDWIIYKEPQFIH